VGIHGGRGAHRRLSRRTDADRRHPRSARSRPSRLRERG